MTMATRNRLTALEQRVTDIDGVGQGHEKGQIAELRRLVDRLDKKDEAVVGTAGTVIGRLEGSSSRGFDFVGEAPAPSDNVAWSTFTTLPPHAVRVAIGALALILEDHLSVLRINTSADIDTRDERKAEIAVLREWLGDYAEEGENEAADALFERLTS